MHLELLIVDGPQAGRRIPLGRNAVTFGRSVGATISFQQDKFMSGMHLSVQFALSCLVVLDLRSSNGTFLNGQRITQALAVLGDVIKIGTLTMQVVMGKVPAAEPEPVEAVASSEEPVIPRTLEMLAVTEPEVEALAGPATTLIAVPEPAEKVHHSVLSLLDGTEHPLFCLVDPGAHATIPSLLDQAREPKESLYDGADDSMLAKFAPYVVQLGPESELLHALVENGWGQGWACFFTSEAPLEELGRHFRKFFMVQLEGGKEVYFRFYDPRVLRGFLPAGSPEELTAFFGPVEEWLLEARNSAMMLKITNGGDRLHTMTIPLSVTASRFRKPTVS
jgi:Domain of unknown function (DUF4123)/Inner membrane component of T3SS, cytoplasmic domain